MVYFNKLEANGMLKIFSGGVRFKLDVFKFPAGEMHFRSNLSKGDCDRIHIETDLSNSDVDNFKEGFYYPKRPKWRWNVF